MEEIKIDMDLNEEHIENEELKKNYTYFLDDNYLNSLKDHIKDLLIIFCNPISGNQEGKIFLDIASHYDMKNGYKIIDFSKISSKEKENYLPIKAVFLKLIDKKEHQDGINLIQNLQRLNNKEIIKVIIAGGDGSVLSMVQQLDKEGININKCIFGHIPLGTGNDLSNALGFNNFVNISNNINSLYKILKKYYNANFGGVDIWNMELQLDKNSGKILENTKNGKVEKKDDKGNRMIFYKRTFINYLSLGYDARVGFNFDKQRTTSRLCNKCVYFWEGFKKNFCRKTISIPGFLESFNVYESSNNPNEKTFLTNNQSMEFEGEKLKIKYCFKSRNSLTELDKGKKTIVIKGEPCSIVFQNINFYMAGVKDIWKEGKEKMSVEVINVNKEEKKKYEQKFKEMADQEQKLDDHKIEIFSFDSGLQTGFEKVIGGLAKKLYHGGGPILLKFKPTPDLNEDDKTDRIYLNIDGEYFHIVQPISMKIDLDKSLCNGCIPFLINRDKV